MIATTLSVDLIPQVKVPHGAGLSKPPADESSLLVGQDPGERSFTSLDGLHEVVEHVWRHRGPEAGRAYGLAQDV